MDSPIASYQDIYSPLQGEKPIRLLTLQPGQGNDPIVCSLVQTNVYNVRGTYEAISYTWGDSVETETILCGGQGFEARRSASNVLRHLRLPTTVRTFWIDAICINQSDLMERGLQVSFMHQIYQNAKQVVVWLGEADDTSDLAMEYASTLEPSTFLDEYLPCLRYGASSDEFWWRKSYIFDSLPATAENKNLINALIKLLSRSWFERAWVQQEAAVGLETLMVCGQKFVSWDQIFAVSWILTPKWSILWPDWVEGDFEVLEPKLRATNSIQTHRFRDKQRRQNANVVLATPFKVLLFDTWACLATDPRDKIYALRNLASDLLFDDWVPTPDYTVAWEEVYIDVAARMFKKGWVDTLAYGGRSRQPLHCNLPSWVPDWSKSSTVQFVEHSGWRAGSKRRSECKVRQLPKRHLRTQNSQNGAVKLDSQDSIAFVGGISESWVKYHLFPSVAAVTKDLEQAGLSFVQNQLPSVYMNGETLQEAYQAALIANTDHEDKPASTEYCESYFNWSQWLAIGAPGEVPCYHIAIENSEVFWKKRFCVTTHGYLCLVPKMVELGDRISILKGYAMPVVLRPREQYFELIGDCYIHGMMDSQAFCLIDEYGCKYDSAFTTTGLTTIVSNSTGQEQQVGAEDYSRIFPTLGVHWVDLV